MSRFSQPELNGSGGGEEGGDWGAKLRCNKNSIHSAEDAYDFHGADGSM